LAFKFSSGLKQSFPSQASKFNLNQYRPQELTTFREDYFPIVISIESLFPESYQGRARKSIQFTYGQFTLDAESKYKFKYLRQKLLVSFSRVT
jgi:hypothetical protein